MHKSEFAKRRILITGGTGAFGRHCTKLLLQCDPAEIVIFSRNEYNQYNMRQAIPDKRLRFLIGDIRDEQRVSEAVQNVDYIIHAAALKHVHFSEAQPEEYIKTNAIGTANLIRAIEKSPAKKCILLSSDKATCAINAYGSSKFLAEKLVVAANREAKRCKYSVTRYGNVFESHGSVLHHYRTLLKEGKYALPLTDEQMTRFWITLDQGARFVLDGFARMKGGEIFIPKLPSIRVSDLVKALHPKATHTVIGKRPGEKTHELMFSADESEQAVEFEEYFIIAPHYRNLSHYLNYAGTKKGRPLTRRWEYSSGSNTHFLSVKEIRAFLA